MSVYVAIPIVLFLFCIVLLVLVLISGLRRPARWPFLLFLVFMSLWGFSIFLMRYSVNLEQAYMWEIWVFLAIVSAAHFFYRFTLSLTGTRENRIILFTVYGLLIAALILVPTGLVVERMQVFWYGKAPVVGPLFPVYLGAAYLPMILGLRMVLRHHRTTRIFNDRVRDSYIILGLIIMLIGGTTDFLPALGVRIYPLGIIGNLIFCILATIAMLRYGLLEFRVVLRRGVAYSFVSLIMLGIVIGCYLLVSGFVKEFSTPIFVIVMTLAFLAIAAVFQPVQSRVQRVIDRWFFRSRYDHLLNLEKFSRETKNISDLKQLSDSLLPLIGLGMESVTVYLLLPTGQTGDFEIYSSYTQSRNNGNRLSFSASSGFVRAMKYQDNAIDINAIDFTPSMQNIEPENIRVLNENNIELIVPLRSKEVLTGILLLTNKTTGDTYSSEDRQLLNTVSNQAAVSIENARLYEQLQQQLIRSSKLASLGELSTSVAHEVNNSLQSVINYGTLIYEDLGEANPLREDAKIIETEALRARNIVEILLGIARKERTSREIIDLNDVIKTVITLVRLRTKTQNITIKEDYSLEAPLVNASTEQLRQVLLNLFSNASDAMPDGGTISVKTTVEEKFVAFSITDTGCGIPSDAKEKIFDSLYTTKLNGTGLGLTVTKSLIDEHKGTIEVESEENRGSRFTIRLPKA